MNKYAYILVEVGKREFESRLLLKRELEKEGFIVIIGLKNILIDLLVLSVFPQGIIFDKCAQFATNWRIKRLKKKGFIYTCLDEEGIFTKLPEVKSRNTDLTNVDYLFLNNKKHFNLVMQANPNGLSSEKILISGNPRQSQTLFNEYKNKRVSSNSNDILIIGNFSQYRKGAEDREWDRGLLGKFDNSSIEIVKSLMKDKNFNVFYRPHPSETLWYENYFPKEKILKNKNILSLLSSFKKIICFRCTTALEGRFLGLKVFNFSNSTPVAPILTRIGSVFRNYDELIKKLSIEDYFVNNPSREKKVLDLLIPFKKPEVIIVQKLNQLSFLVKRSIYFKICVIFSHFLWFLYKIWYKKESEIMLEKFYTDEIEERLLRKDIKKIGSFIYS